MKSVHDQEFVSRLTIAMVDMHCMANTKNTIKVRAVRGVHTIFPLSSLAFRAVSPRIGDTAGPIGDTGGPFRDTAGGETALGPPARPGYQSRLMRRDGGCSPWPRS